MSTSSANMPSTDMASFKAHLSQSKRIVALLGAGLSASSGLPTFRGAGGYWRTHDATLLATPQAFRSDPGLVWQFYSYRRHMALNAKPNRAHLALASLSKVKPELITLSQNVDGLSPRAGHPAEQLMLLHGSLFDIKCSNCDYVKHDDFTDPIVPALAIPNDPVAARETLAKAARQQSVDKANLAMHISQKSAQINKTQSPTIPNEPLSTATQPESDSNSSPLPTHPLVKGLDISSIEIPLTTIPPSSLPQCPKCTSLLRPGVVWFGESLPESVLSQVDNYFFPPTSHSTAFNLTSPSSVSDNDGEKIDLMLVIGTSSKVYPAAGYTNLARQRGARVAVVNLDVEDLMVNGRGRGEMGKGDWVFQGDAAELVPQMFEEIVGKVGEYED